MGFQQCPVRDHIDFFKSSFKSFSDELGTIYTCNLDICYHVHVSLLLLFSFLLYMYYHCSTKNFERFTMVR